MKILIIGFAKIKYMPYLNMYLENLNRESNEIHLVYWNRDEQDEDLSCLEGIKIHEFKCYQEDEVPKISKITNFIKFRKFVKAVLKDKFDFLIVLQTVTAVLLSDILLSPRFKRKYIFDYRDYTYENIKIYRMLVEMLAGNSHATLVSSKGFKKYLPKSEKINFVHNVLSEELNCTEEMFVKTPSERIRIGFWGFIREEAVNQKIIEKVSRDVRFELHYYGREQKTALNLKKYVVQNNITNVYFHGEYNPADRYEFFRNTDIVHNVYSGENMLCATSNKYYDAVISGTPQICMMDSYMGNLVRNAGIGCSVDPYNENFIQDIYEYFTSVNVDELREKCNLVKRKIVEENNDITNIIKKVAMGKWE